MEGSVSEYKGPEEIKFPKGASRNENCQYINLSRGTKFQLANFLVNKSLTSLVIFLQSLHVHVNRHSCLLKTFMLAELHFTLCVLLL